MSKVDELVKAAGRKQPQTKLNVRFDADVVSRLVAFLERTGIERHVFVGAAVADALDRVVEGVDGGQ